MSKVGGCGQADFDPAVINANQRFDKIARIGGIKMVEQDLLITVDEVRQVSGALSRPEKTAKAAAGVVLAHGAGNDRNHPLLVALSRGLSPVGYAVLRFNFPYREFNRNTPDPQPVLERSWKAALETLRQHVVAGGPVFGAGKSLGGRLASQMAAAGTLDLEGLIFMGYPLHPPGKTDRLRDGHLYQIERPMLFFAGTRDPFCELSHLLRVLNRLRAPWELEVIEGGDHSFKLPAAAERTNDPVYGRLLQRSVEWLDRVRAHL